MKIEIKVTDDDGRTKLYDVTNSKHFNCILDEHYDDRGRLDGGTEICNGKITGIIGPTGLDGEPGCSVQDDEKLQRSVSDILKDLRLKSKNFGTSSLIVNLKYLPYFDTHRIEAMRLMKKYNKEDAIKICKELSLDYRNEIKRYVHIPNSTYKLLQSHIYFWDMVQIICLNYEVIFDRICDESSNT